MATFSTTVYSDNAGNFFDANGNPIDVSQGVLTEGACPPEKAPSGPVGTEPWCFIKGQIHDTVYRRSDGVYVNLAGEPVTVTGGSLVQGACATDTPYEAIRYCYNPCQGKASFGVWRHEDGSYVNDQGEPVDVTGGTLSEGECPTTFIPKFFCWTDSASGITTTIRTLPDGGYEDTFGNPINPFDVEGILLPGRCDPLPEVEVWCAIFPDGTQGNVYRLPTGEYTWEDGSPVYTIGATLTRGGCLVNADAQWCYTPYDGGPAFNVTQSPNGLLFDSSGNQVSLMLGTLAPGFCTIFTDPAGLACMVWSDGADPTTVTEDPNNAGQYLFPSGEPVDLSEGTIEPGECAAPTSSAWCLQPYSGDPPLTVYPTESGLWIDGDSGDYVDVTQGDLLLGECSIYSEPADMGPAYCFAPFAGGTPYNVFHVNGQWVNGSGQPIDSTLGTIVAGACVAEPEPSVQYCYDGSQNVWQLPDGSYNTAEDGSGDPFTPADPALLVQGDCPVAPTYYCCGTQLDALGNPTDTITVTVDPESGQYIDSSGNQVVCETVTSGACTGDST